MLLLKRLLFWTMLLQGFIVITAGHGAGIMIMLDCFALIDYADFIKEETFTLFPQKGSNDLGFAIVFSIVGKVFTIVALFTKKQSRFLLLSFIGLVQLWLSFFYLSYGLSDNNSVYLSFVSGLPFLGLSLIYVVFVFIHRRHYKTT